MIECRLINGGELIGNSANNIRASSEEKCRHVDTCIFANVTPCYSAIGPWCDKLSINSIVWLSITGTTATACPPPLLLCVHSTLQPICALSKDHTETFVTLGWWHLDFDSFLSVTGTPVHVRVDMDTQANQAKPFQTPTPSTEECVSYENRITGQADLLFA